MNGFNKVILAGNLTRDPEQRFLPNGNAVATWGMALNRKWTVDGQAREETIFVDVTAFAKTAELASQYLKKGGPLLLEGRLKLDTWDDRQTGQKRSKLVVVAEAITFLSNGTDAAQGAQGVRPNTPEQTSRGGNRPTNQERQREQPPEDGMPPAEDDEVPF
jgi:single-strand DNA-binding protein